MKAAAQSLVDPRTIDPLTLTPLATFFQNVVYKAPVIVINVAGTARPQGSKRHAPRGRNRFRLVEMSPYLESWRGQVAWSAQQVVSKRRRFALMQGPVELLLLVSFRRPKSWPKDLVWPTGPPDVSKLLRAVEDALSGIVYRDDAQIVSAWASKWAFDPPGVRLVVREIVAPQRRRGR